MRLTELTLKELWHHKSQLISGLLAITLGIGVIVGIRSISVVSEKAVAINLDNLGANILILPQAASVDNYYAADIDAPTFPESYVEKLVTSTLPGVDNLSPKLTRRVDVNGQKIVLTGILPKSEIASKPIWQQGGLIGNDISASCAPTGPKKYADEKLQRKGIDTLAAGDCFVGSAIAQRMQLAEGSTLTVEGKEFSIKKILPDTRITTIGQIVSTQIETNKLMNKLSLVFLIIILFVGGISIGNYIWANVNERRKEIGILRMIGYHKRHIYNILIFKALIMGITGGVAGYMPTKKM